MKLLEEIVFQSGECQEGMKEYIAGICFEINKMKANSPNIQIDSLLSQLTLLITYCDTVIMENEENRRKLDLSLKESAFLVSKLSVEKKQREADLNSSLQFQEIEQEENLVLTGKVREMEKKIKFSIDKYNSLFQDNSSLKQDNKMLKIEKVSLEENLKKKDTTIANLKLNLQTIADDLTSLQSKSSWGKEKWVDDSVLNDYFAAMADNIDSKDILFLGPSVTAAIKLASPEMIVECLNKTSFYECKYVFLCVNNSNDSEREDSGSHWSLLFLEKSNNKAYHLDSMRPMNNLSAQVVARKLSIEKSDVIEIPCIQQKQSFDCGLHVLANAKYIAYHYCTSNMTDNCFADWHAGKIKCNYRSDIVHRKLESFKKNKEETSSISNLPYMHRQTKKLNKWHKVPKSNKLSKRKLITSIGSITKNRFEVLEKLNEGSQDKTDLANRATKSFIPHKSTSKIRETQDNSSSELEVQCEKVNHRIIMGSDSQGRDLSSYLQQASHSKYNSFNYCYPNAPLELIIDSITSLTDLNNLSTTDYVVLLGGTNNITRMATLNSKHFLQTLEDYLEKKQELFKHTNVILSTIPYRYDLRSEGPENILIKEANTIIRQLAYKYSHVQLLDLYLIYRCYHTRHGLHLNKNGKKFICKEIMHIIDNPSKSLKPEGPGPCSALSTSSMTLGKSVSVSEPLLNCRPNEPEIMKSRLMEQSSAVSSESLVFPKKSLNSDFPNENCVKVNSPGVPLLNYINNEDVFNLSISSHSSYNSDFRGFTTPDKSKIILLKNIYGEKTAAIT